MQRVEKSERLFKEGYNCSQAVVGAFSDLLPFDFDTLTLISSGFGGGMGTRPGGGMRPDGGGQPGGGRFPGGNGGMGNWNGNFPWQSTTPSETEET